MVLIGIDPHKSSHTAVVVDGDEKELARLKVRADRRQLQRLLAFAQPYEFRTWAIESAGGLGFLLAQQLVAAGEDVVDVPPVLAARVRLLGSGRGSKNDPNDALSTAIAALRDPHLRTVTAENHVMVLRLLADRHQDLTALRTQAVGRLHALLAALVPGGVQKRLSANAASEFLRRVHPVTAVETQRKALAADLVADVRRLDRAIAEVKARHRDRGHRLRHVGHRRLWGWSDRRRAADRALRGHHPVPECRALRELQRHRADRGVIRTEGPPPAQHPREPSAQPRPALWPPSPRSDETPQAGSTTTANSKKARAPKKPDGR